MTAEQTDLPDAGAALQSSASTSPTVDVYRLMLVAREFEHQLGEIFASGRLAGWFHSCIGHEATGANYARLLRQDDHLVPYHRSRVSLFAKGMTVREVGAEMMGRSISPSKGRGGDGHMVHADRRIYGMSGVLGASISIATGLAYASQVRGTDEVTLNSFGEGTANRGTFHEALNMASVWRLPIVFVCENNLYVEFSPAREQMNVADVASRAAGYGMPSAVVDGNDPDASRPVLEEAVDRARSGGGPTLIEAKTYRLRGHYDGDPEAYRPREEVAEWAARDPLLTYPARLTESGVATASELDALRAEISEEVRSDLEYVLAADKPTAESVTQDVYAGAEVPK